MHPYFLRLANLSPDRALRPMAVPCAAANLVWSAITRGEPHSAPRNVLTASAHAANATAGGCFGLRSR